MEMYGPPLDITARMKKSVSLKKADELLRKSEVKISTIQDVTSIVNKLIDNATDGEVTVQVSTTNPDTRKIEKISSKSKNMSLYSMLLEGLDKVKVRLASYENLKAVAERTKDDGDIPINVRGWDAEHIRFNVDNLIEKRLGGKRHNLRVRWVIDSGTYEFDPYTKKLYQVMESKDGSN